MIDAVPSYRCKVNSGNNRGSLRIGMRRYKVAVLEMSRDSFTVRVPLSIANKLTPGSTCKLFYQEMLWRVKCCKKLIGASNQIEIEFQQLEELTKPKLRKLGFSGTANPVAAAGQSDPTLPFALIVAFIIAVLISPAWGGQWGTSERMCAAVTSTWTALVQLATGSR